MKDKTPKKMGFLIMLLVAAVVAAGVGAVYFLATSISSLWDVVGG